MAAIAPWLTLALAGAAPVAAQDRSRAAATLAGQVEAAMAQAGPGLRYGLLIVDDAGREIVAIRSDERFIPASNTKLFSTAAAFATLPVDAPDAAGGASVRIEEGDVILTGRGDARLSSAAECAVDCLAELADAVAARTRVVRDVVGDASRLPDQRWGDGVSWDDLQTRYGTAMGALTIDDNVVPVTVKGAAAPGPATIESDGYWRVVNQVASLPGAETRIVANRRPGSDTLYLTGVISTGVEHGLLLGLDDPAHRAAWRLAQLLRARGVKVTGGVSARHRPFAPSDDPALRKGAPAPLLPEPPALARLTPPPLAEDMRTVNKQSQNLHADLTLRRVGMARGSGSIEDGLAAVDAMLAQAGVPRHAYAFSDGSGMSVYNRVTPRATVTLLRWAQAKPWWEGYHATLPIAGVDGTLARRFRDTPLAGRLFAKTGTLSGVNALAGTFTAASGARLTFAFYVNDAPRGAGATLAMDRALQAVAAAN